MPESIHQYVLEELARAKGSWPAIAEATGISYRTIEKIARQETEDPGVSLIERLAEHFRASAAANNRSRASARA